MDPFTTRFLDRLPPALARSFSADQLDAIHHAFGARYRVDHAVDVRRTMKLPWGRFYVVILVGRDRRQESERRPLCRAGQAALDVLAVIAVAASVVLGLLIVGQALTSFFAPGDFVALAGG